MKIKVVRIRSLLEYAIIFLYVISSTMAVWRYVPGNSKTANMITYMVYLLVAVYGIANIVISGSGEIKKRDITLVALVLAYNILYSIISRDTSSTFYMWMLLPLLIMLILCCSLKNCGRLKQFVMEFETIILVLAIISCILYFGGEIFHVLPYKMTTVTRGEMATYSIKSYLGLTYIGQSQTVFGITFARNTGIFLEGPSWGSFLWPAFFVELFVKEKPSKFNVIALSVTAITTFSAKAIIFMMIIAGLKYISDSVIKTHKGDTKFNYKVLIWPFLICVISVVVFNLLTSKSTFEGGSIVARLDDTVATFTAWKNNVLFGCGFYNESYIRSFMTGNTLRGNTAGLLKVFALGGIFIGIEYLGGIILFIKNSLNSVCEKIAFGGLFIINLFLSSTFNSLFSLFFVALGLTYILGKGNGYITDE